MKLEVHQQDDVAVVILQGTHLDASNYREFKTELTDVLKKHTKIVLDLETLQFIDSSGIGAILSALRKANNAGGQLRMCCVADQVRTIFNLVRMERIAALDATRQESLNALAET